LGDNYYRFARLKIDYLNEKYGFDFKEGDYTTLCDGKTGLGKNLEKTEITHRYETRTQKIH
jgi:hypothetical protein